MLNLINAARSALELPGQDRQAAIGRILRIGLQVDRLLEAALQRGEAEEDPE